jgi:diguanylate cyclase (GGDEF)-like protein
MDYHETHFRGLFEHSPVSLWEEDYSQVKQALEALRAGGLLDLRPYIVQHPEFVDACMALIRVVDVNRQTLKLFEAETKTELLNNLDRVFRDEMRAHFADELSAMWSGQLAFEGVGVNYSLSGRPIDIYLRWSILPGCEATWERALVSIVDITDQQRAQRALAVSEEHARGLFEHSPVSLWVEDYAWVKRHLDDLRRGGVEDLRAYLTDHPETIDLCMRHIGVVDVNRQTLLMFGAASKADLLANLNRVFRDEMRAHFSEELLVMWSGKLEFEGEGINYSLNGSPLDIYLRWSVMPGYEQSWERALVSIVDITARKKAEAYLKYLGTHDVLTGLYNRAYFEEERARLERGRRFPVSVLLADLNGLKLANDQHGHDAGDTLLRRAAEVLRAAFRQEDVVARIGGDEFAALMAETDAYAAGQTLRRIEKLVALNNQFYQGPLLSLAVGTATGNPGVLLAQVQRQADDQMYEQKRRYHQVRGEPGRDG